MPRGDGRGPAGLGPKTGRAAGFCTGSGQPGYMNPATGRGYSRWSGLFTNFGRRVGGFWGRGFRSIGYSGFRGRGRGRS